MDFTTINVKELKKLPVYTLPRSYSLQHAPGNGCFGDAPGYPTYFTRAVYTKHDNIPPRGPQMVIVFEERNYVVADAAEEPPARLHTLWAPLPYGCERVRIWIERTYQHFAHCYQDVERLVDNRPPTLIFPIPYYQQSNAKESTRAARIAVAENHEAYLRVHAFYTEHTPDLALIANPPKLIQADWWDTDAVRPTPQTCKPRWGVHRSQPGTHCHWCGYDTPKGE